MKLHHVRIELGEANAFVAQHHRHHKPVVGHLFSIGAVAVQVDPADGLLKDKIVGVVIVGRPVSRMRDDGQTAEVTRLCTTGERNACSFLYGAAPALEIEAVVAFLKVHLVSLTCQCRASRDR